MSEVPLRMTLNEIEGGCLYMAKKKKVAKKAKKTTKRRKVAKKAKKRR
jgi:hypothetical protein